MPLRIGLLFLPLFLLSTVPAAAGQRYCRSFIEPTTILSLCPASPFSSIHLGSESRFGNNLTIKRPFDMQAGETAVVYHYDLGRPTSLFVSAAGNSAIFSINQKKSIIKIGAGGTIAVNGDKDHRRQSPTYRLATKSPESTINKLSQALREINSRRSREVICASLDRDALVFYRFFYGQPEIFDCPYTMRVFFLGSDRSSAVKTIDSHLLDIKYANKKRSFARLAVHTRLKDHWLKEKEIILLLSRDSQGSWRVENPTALMPLARNGYQTRAEKESRDLRRQGRYWRSLYFARGLPFTTTFERLSPLR